YTAIWTIESKGSSATSASPSFFSAFAGSMRYYNNTIETGGSTVNDSKVAQALMIYVYNDSIVLQMKNYAQTGTINGVAIKAIPESYKVIRKVTNTGIIPQETNKAITIPKTASKIGYRLQVPETILGDRNGGATDRTGKSFTLSSWVNIDQVTNDAKNKGCVIMGHGPQEHMNYNGSLILCIDENRNLKIISGAGNTYSKEFSGSTIALDTWTYLTLVYNDATHKVTVYKDGTLVGESGTQNTSLTLFGDDPTIFFVGGMGFSGCCDDFQFFKAALTAEEVKTAYETPESLASLTAWYNFNTIDDGVGSFLNKSTASAKASEKATFYKYTGTISSDPGLITGRVTEVAPTLVLGRTNSNVKHTITYNSPTGATVEVYNGTTLLASGTEVKEGTTLTVKIAITDPTKM
ncbi:MAG: LamG domain-containing protein, partial [Bacteroides sp.]